MLCTESKLNHCLLQPLQMKVVGIDAVMDSNHTVLKTCSQRGRQLRMSLVENDPFPKHTMSFSFDDVLQAMN